MRKLTKPLQQLALVERQLGAVHAHGKLLAQRPFLDKTLLQASNDLGVHAAVMITSYLSNTFTHPIWKAYDEFVSRAAGVNSLFHWAHSFNRYSSGGGAVLEVGRTMFFGQ